MLTGIERPLLVLSPHLDDAVLSCGRLLADAPGALVVTIFAGRPPAGAPLTAWDAAAGFAFGDDVIGARRAEDAAALAVLGAHPLWLGFRDAQYGGADPPRAIADRLAPLVAAAPGAVLAPLGLFHSDHVRARDAALLALRDAPGGPLCLLYADAPYARRPELLAAGLAELRARGLRLVPVLPAARGRAAPRVAKQRALACYGSQLRALAAPGRPGPHPGRERFWRVMGLR